MKLEKNLLSLPKILAATFINILLLSNLIGTEARSCSRRHPCTSLDLRGPWSIGPRKRGDIFGHMSEIISMPVRLNSLFEQQQRQIENMYERSSPRYDISEDDEKMELAFELPGVNAEDLSLELQQEGKVLKIFGSREYKHRGQLIKSEFDQMFTIDPANLDVEHISANLSDGILVVSAPKLKPRLPKKTSIPIKFGKDDKNSDEVKVSSERHNTVQADKHAHGTIEDSMEEATKTEVDGLEITEEEDI